MVKNKDRWSALSMKERADLINMYITNGISELKEMKKHYNGIPYRDLNTSDYDYFNASPEMIPTEEGQHWDSRNPHTGRLLKGENHPTFDLMVESENKAGYKIVRGYNGELYSIPNTPDNYVENYNSFSDGGRVLDGAEEEQTLSGEPIYLGELEPAVVKPKPLDGYLNTYYPLVSPFPFTGHSELQLVDFGFKEPITITKYGTDYDYNLVTNNCSDATRCAVEQIFGEKINPVLFTTPGDVQDFVAEKTGQEPFKEDVGQTSLGFEVPFATAMDLKNQNIDFYIQDYLHKSKEFKKKQQKENPKWDSSGFDESVKKVIEGYENLKYKFQPFVEGYEIDESGNYRKANGGKLNIFDIGGPTREMTPLEAAALNKTLNNSQYMIAVGDSPDSPAYLSTDELQPAIVIAERKNPTSEDIEKEKRNFAKKIRGRSLVGHIGGVGPTLGDTSLSDIAATAIGIPLFMTNPVGQALLNTTLKTYNTPGIKQAADTYFTYEGLNNLISDNGIKKTANLFKNKEYAKGVKSAIGDIMDAAGPVFLMDDLYKLGKEGVRLGKWMTRSANDVLNINTSEDALNAAVNNYKKYINPTADISNYDVRFVENLPKDTWGGLYFPDTKRINIKTRDNKVDEMTSLIHEMRHQDDPFLHKKRQTFTLDSSSRPTGRLQLDNGQIETLNAAYGDVKNTLEHITTNTDLRSILELQYIKETGKIPTVNQLNTYIEKLSPFSLGLAKAGANGYTANTIFPSLFNTDYIKDALMFVRKDGGAINRFDIGGDKDTWYKKLYSWIFNDDNVEETPPQENKYLTNDNYLDEVSKFISTFEEFYPNAYEDTHNGKNIWTVGSGLTYFLDDEGNEIKVKKGDTITKEENINQLNKRLQKNIDYVKSKTQYWDNYPAELKFQLLDAMYNIGAPKVWNPETNYIKAIMQYENEKGWENPEYDLKNIFQHADWNLNNKGWLGIRSRMRRNPQSINVEDFSKIYKNDYRDSLRTAYDLKFQNN